MKKLILTLLLIGCTAETDLKPVRICYRECQCNNRCKADKDMCQKCLANCLTCQRHYLQ